MEAGICERGEPQSFQNVYSVGWMRGANDGKRRDGADASSGYRA